MSLSYINQCKDAQETEEREKKQEKKKPNGKRECLLYIEST